jgi:hypothetical protein
MLLVFRAGGTRPTPFRPTTWENHAARIALLPAANENAVSPSETDAPRVRSVHHTRSAQQLSQAAPRRQKFEILLPGSDQVFGSYGESRFDKYAQATVTGDGTGQQALSQQEVRGLWLFSLRGSASHATTARC